MYLLRWTGTLILSVGIVAFCLAQPKPPPPPTFPPLDLAVAKLSGTATLDTGITALAFDEEKGILIVAGEDRVLRIWMRTAGKDLLAADVQPALLKGHDRAVTAVAAGGGLQASGATDGRILVWKYPADKPVHSLTTSTPVRGLAFAPDGKTLASVGDDGAVQLWDPAQGKLLRKLTGSTDWLLAVGWSADSKNVAAGGQDGKLWAWEAASSRKLFDVLGQAPIPPKTEIVTNILQAIAFSPDGKQLGVGGSDGKVYQFQFPEGKFVRALPGHTSTITGLAYHPGLAALASVSRDRTVRLWSPANGQPLKTLEGQTSWVEGVAFMDKGTRLVTAGADRTVRVWELTKPVPPEKGKK